MLSRLMDNPSTPRVVNIQYDFPLMAACVFLIIFGLLMVTSSSLELAAENFNGNAFHYIIKQTIYLIISGIVGYAIYLSGIQIWLSNSGVFFVVALLVLLLVLLAGIEAYGSQRWLSLGVVSVQPSEFAKLVLILFVANYIQRHGTGLRRSFREFIKPMLAILLLSLPVLAEPDFGTMMVMMLITSGMLFLAGAKLWHFILCGIGLSFSAALLVVTAPYRWARFTGFMDPWRERYEEGYQLVQSLVAIGSGSWIGAGLGESMQKLFYLPKAHTDFIFSILAEETGFLGVASVIGCYFFIVFRCFVIARRAEQQQKMCARAYVAYGVGIWIGLQAFINIAVAMGALPTKGITLPFISAGGSSLLTVFVAIAMVHRIHAETCHSDRVLVRRYEQRQEEAAYG